MRLCWLYDGLQGGAYLLQLLDDCAVSWGLLVIALVEVLSIFWMYGNKYTVSMLFLAAHRVAKMAL